MVWAAALVFLAAGAERVDPLATGNTFLDQCGKPLTATDLMTFGLCHGFLGGLIDRDVYATNRAICRPVGSSNGQVMDVVLAYLRANPQNRHLPPGVLATVALRDAFPCVNAKK